MKTKKVNPNIQAEKAPKKEMPPVKTYHQEYHVDLFSWGKMPVTDEYLRKFAAEWVDRAQQDEDMLLLWEFATLKRVLPDKIEDWAKRCPELKQAREMVRKIVGERREKGALKKKLDAYSVFRNQHYYDAMDKASEEWRTELKSKQAQSGASTGPITVVMPKFKIDTKGNAVEDKDDE